MTWQAALDSQGSRDIARLGQFFRRLPWHQLEPDPEERLVPAGLVVVIAVADMEDLAECRRVKAPVTEELGKRADRGRGATEVRREVVDPERLGAESRQQRVSRR